MFRPFIKPDIEIPKKILDNLPSIGAIMKKFIADYEQNNTITEDDISNALISVDLL